MKTYIVLSLLLCFAFCAPEAQETEAQLPYEHQVEYTEDSWQYYYDFLKGIFLEKETLLNQCPMYKQCDAKWKNDVMGTKTVCQVGCLMSSVSMALAGNGRTLDGAPVTPGSLNAWLKKHGGYSGNLFVWGAITSTFNVKYLGKFGDGSAYLDKDKFVILNVHNGGHWVLATGFSNGAYQVLDPGYQTTSYKPSEVKTSAVYQML